jgi:hypothetical protein
MSLAEFLYLCTIVGDEEVQYVYIEMPDDLPEETTAPGADITIKVRSN